MLSTSLGRPPMAGFNTGGAGLSCGSPQPAYGYSSDGWTHRVAIVYAQITTTYPKNTHDSRFGISDGRMPALFIKYTGARVGGHRDPPLSWTLCCLSSNCLRSSRTKLWRSSPSGCASGISPCNMARGPSNPAVLLPAPPSSDLRSAGASSLAAAAPLTLRSPR